MNPPVTTQRILYDVCRRSGLVPTGPNTNLDPDKAYEILGYMDDRLREAWELYDFVETCFCEQRAFAPDFDPNVCYAQGDIVWDSCSGQYYQALAQTIGGPVSNETFWAPNPNVAIRWIPYWQDGHTPIGTCYSAWTKNPYEDKSRVRLRFLASSRGLEFTTTSTSNIVWLVFRIPYPGLARAEWDPTLTYAKGDAALDGMDTYICSVEGTIGLQPSLTPANWTQFRIPYPFSRFVAQAAFSDTLVTEGQNEKAPGELGKAYGYLQAAIDQQDLQQGLLETWEGYSTLS